MYIVLVAFMSKCLLGLELFFFVKRVIQTKFTITIETCFLLFNPYKFTIKFIESMIDNELENELERIHFSLLFMLSYDRPDIYFLLYFPLFYLFQSAITGGFFLKTTSTSRSSSPPSKPPVKVNYPLKCVNEALTFTCPTNYPVTFESKVSSAVACPEYFRWIREDLRPWRDTGITRSILERGKNAGDLRLVIVNGKAYVKMYRKAFQTRDVFTIWGILQLLRLYPGKVPDLELLFSCGDKPLIMKSDYQWPHTTSPPPVFHYCADADSLDIPFPDWSFWGW